jgi:hypothetical protein
MYNFLNFEYQCLAQEESGKAGDYSDYSDYCVYCDPFLSFINISATFKHFNCNVQHKKRVARLVTIVQRL